MHMKQSTSAGLTSFYLVAPVVSFGIFIDDTPGKLWCCKFEVVVSKILNCFFGFALMDIAP